MYQLNIFDFLKVDEISSVINFDDFQHPLKKVIEDAYKKVKRSDSTPQLWIIGQKLSDACGGYDKLQEYQFGIYKFLVNKDIKINDQPFTPLGLGIFYQEVTGFRVFHERGSYPVSCLGQIKLKDLYLNDEK